MGGNCKGICEPLKVKRPSPSPYAKLGLNYSRYANGQKYCRTCSAWLMVSEPKNKCICCHLKLATLPRHNKLYRERMYARKKAAEAEERQRLGVVEPLYGLRHRTRGRPSKYQGQDQHIIQQFNTLNTK